MRFLIIVLLVAETICVGAQTTGKFFHLYYKSRGKAIMLYACNHSNCEATYESCSVLAVEP